MIRTPYFFSALALLAFAIVAPFLFKGPLSWTAGLLYIGYDTCLLGFVSFAVARILRKTAAGSETPPARRVSIAVLIPARNEGAWLPPCLEALRGQTDRPDEIHVIDDGSTDDTFAQLETRYATDHRIRIWKKPHTGKADSLNQVFPAIRAEVILTLDADTLLEPQAIAEIRRAFGASGELAVAGGTLVPCCREDGVIARALELYQRFEYIRAFLARRAWMEADALLLVSGAFAAYRKEALQAVGGFDARSLVEDYEIVHRMHRYRFETHRRWKVEVLPRARARTDAPGDLLSFLRQRRRWFAGFLQTHFRSVDMIGNHLYGNVGKIILPIKSIDTLQPVYGVLAFFTLIGILFCGRSLGPVLLGVILAKLTLDLFFHFWSIQLYCRWQRLPARTVTWIAAAVVTATEPFTFQLLRHVGAVWGWLSVFRAHDEWTPTPSPLRSQEIGS